MFLYLLLVLFPPSQPLLEMIIEDHELAEQEFKNTFCLIS